MRFYIHTFIPVGELIWVRVKLPAINYLFEAIAQIRWIEESTSRDRYEIGVEFTDISPEAREKLDHFLG